ncbi:hypothetical protein [Polymorphobacter fuscus]|uniref:PEPxxWA-CTERM sorting domain-containing protein n=1 Tax=Sandarakinorhabdus fusca TaxID=1439888 RepID=A0A7C9GTF7_9SPHN|nr:hypothetical protein [Polymorphobacter fuscus]KAB7643870.1 hypothetical protein F9290_15055 [Polymorphobacter fuscus]MQT18571.1 hypothetical protein [Polymorphobacter fuscus]
MAHRVRAAIKPRPAVHQVIAPAAAIAGASIACPPTVAGLGAGGAGFSAFDSSASLIDRANPGGGVGLGGGLPLPGGGGLAGGIGGGGPGGSALPSAPITSPAPEVATWAMMVTGVGVVGGSMRWRRRALA